MCDYIDCDEPNDRVVDEANGLNLCAEHADSAEEFDQELSHMFGHCDCHDKVGRLL